MNKNRINCWEYMKCGREPGGRSVDELGVCPASIDASYDGINTGKNGGRIFWAVAGTCCNNKIQGTYAEKRNMMTWMKAKAGERIAIQGEIRETSYIIQRGSCIVLVEKDGVLHPSGHRSRGQMIGITSVLTGEPQRAHTEAETEKNRFSLTT